MMSSPSLTQTETVVLKPSYRLPIALAIAALPLGWLSLWAGIPVGLFALFLGPKFASFPMQTGIIGKFIGLRCPFCFTFVK
jgi:hypothetical protein